MHLLVYLYASAQVLRVWPVSRSRPLVAGAVGCSFWPVGRPSSGHAQYGLAQTHPTDSHRPATLHLLPATNTQTEREKKITGFVSPCLFIRAWRRILTFKQHSATKYELSVIKGGVLSSVCVYRLMWFTRTRNCIITCGWPSCTLLSWVTRTCIASSKFKMLKKKLPQICHKFLVRLRFRGRVRHFLQCKIYNTYTKKISVN